MNEKLLSEASKARLKERLIQLTRDLVLIESTDDKPKERLRCLHLIHNHLDGIPGLRLATLEVNGYHSLLALPPHPHSPSTPTSATAAAPYTPAAKRFSMPDILLNGHLDVVKHATPGSYRSEIRHGRIYGPGSGDMKGQLAIMIELLRRLKSEHPELSVGLAITSDEEIGGKNGVQYLVEDWGLRCGTAIIPDGGSLNKVTEQEKGVLRLQLCTIGTSAHAARPWVATNAIETLLDAISTIRALFPPINRITPCETNDDDNWFNTCVTSLIGSTNRSPNRIPGDASATIDIRFVPPSTSEQLLSQIQSCLPDNVSMTSIMSSEPSHFSPDPLFLKIIQETTQTSAKVVKSAGASDARFFPKVGIPALISCPLIGNIHSRDEWIDIDSMLTYYDILYRYIIAKLGST